MYLIASNEIDKQLTGLRIFFPGLPGAVAMKDKHPGRQITELLPLLPVALCSLLEPAASPNTFFDVAATLSREVEVVFQEQRTLTDTVSLPRRDSVCSCAGSHRPDTGLSQLSGS